MHLGQLSIRSSARVVLRAQSPEYIKRRDMRPKNRLKLALYCFFACVVLLLWITYPRPAPRPPPRPTPAPTKPPTFSLSIGWLDRMYRDPPRVLVVMIGNFRGGELAWRSFRRNVLEAHRNVDLALCTAGEPPKTLMDVARYHWPVQETDDWGAYLDETCTSWRRFCKLRASYLGGIANCTHSGSAGILLAFREQVRRRLKTLTTQYDAYLLTRTDHVYRCEHPGFWRFDPDAIWVRAGEEYNGYSDRHIFAYNHLIDHVLNMTEPLCDPASPTYTDIDMNLETLQLRTWRAPVRKFPAPVFSVRAPGDPTRWSPGENDTELMQAGVLVKYPSELRLARDICGI